MSALTKIRIVSLFVVAVAMAILLTITHVIVTPSLIGKILTVVGTVLALGGFTAWIHSDKVERFFQRLK